ncbi:FadR/GntR family transcriptional regulator [Celeribacter indicus]|uniref:GntR family transcriptional regulator n=1 Tax=Celeribacter indicus TaxID=1208324 RepID=A0A0B5DZ91_9RHOB|nr:FadR/GntR family transcriptional regulator [Celeribacter indicus]AJE48738.1 GntR family transcriptional regulator [Celeribacter indicus]SDX11764.1 transcriptional regulator, GntR family [Celeribacter indicus]
MPADSDLNIINHKETARGDYTRVLAFLRDQLLTGKIKTGDKLLPERDLSALLNVSRPVLREALRALAMIGAVEVRHGAGTYVTTPDASSLSDFFSFVLVQHGEQFDDILEARIAIEHHAIRLACARATQSDYDNMSRILDRIHDTIEDAQQGADADFAFHTAIVTAARSPALSTIYGALSRFLTDLHFVRRQRILQVTGIRSYLIDHHASLLDAIVRRDPAAADRLLAEHFQIGADFNRRAVLSQIKRPSSPT